MNKPDFENKSLVYIILIGYVSNFVFSTIGWLFDNNSANQILFYQIGNAFAISASVMAARYAGLRGQQVAGSAYILLGIAHGISLASLSKAGINPDREVTMAMPMIPSLIFMLWCSLYPRWLHILALVPCMLFAMVYVNFHSGEPVFGWALYTGYVALQINEVLWGIYLFMDWKKVKK
jgi:hypothetical protein